MRSTNSYGNSWSDITASEEIKRRISGARVLRSMKRLTRESGASLKRRQKRMLRAFPVLLLKLGTPDALRVKAGRCLAMRRDLPIPLRAKESITRCVQQSFSPKVILKAVRWIMKGA